LCELYGGGVDRSPILRFSFFQGRPHEKRLVPRRAWLLCVCLWVTLSASWVSLRTRDCSGLLGVLFEPPCSRHQSRPATMTDGPGPSSRPAHADWQHPRFSRPDFGPAARFFSEEEYNREWKPCCEYCHRAQDVSPFYCICPFSWLCPWATRPCPGRGFAWRFNFEVHYWSKTRQQRFERRICPICRLVKGLLIVQPVDCPSWCAYPWAAEEPLTRNLFWGTTFTETWYDHNAHRAAERRNKPPNSVAKGQPPDAKGLCETLSVDENSRPPRPHWWWSYSSSTTLSRWAPSYARHFLR